MEGIELSTRDGHSGIGVGHIPGRKNAALYLKRGAMIEVMAYFRDDECAGRVVSWLDWFGEQVGISREKEHGRTEG